MSRSRKIIIAVVAIIVLIAAIVFLRWVVHYRMYNVYKNDLSSYEYEEGTTYQALSETISDVKEMDLVAENDTLKLYADTETGYVAVVDKRNGQITYSNPLDADDDPVANTANVNYLKSQLVVDYFNTSRTQGTFDSYSYCTSLGQLEVESIEDGIRFIYTIGDLSSATGIVPQYISVDTLNDVISKLPDDEASFVSKKYIDSKVADNYMELLESAVSGASQLRKLNTYFEEVGFTEDDYIREMEGSGVEGAVPISFVIPLEYRLDDDAVDVSIPMCAVEENGGGTIYRIQMLRYFGAAGTDEDGYMLVPNGSGSLINFNNGKSSVENYSEYVYGMDLLTADYTVVENTEDTKMALYGIFRDDSSIFATIEDGASLSYLTAGVSGKVNSYNYVYPTFVLRGNDKLSMFGTTGNEADLPIVETKFYDVDLTVKYTMLAGDETDYSAAANYYRERLVSEGALTDDESGDGDIKFYYDVLGGVSKSRYFLGIKYTGTYSMTTFAQAEEISDDLAASGITNQVMNFQGWMNRGYYHDVVNQIHVMGKLGGKSGLKSLNSTVSENGGILYADVAFQKVTEISRRYSSNSETSRYYGGGYIADFGLVNPATMRRTSGLGYNANLYYLISPKFLVRYVNKFTNKIGNYDVDGISLRDLGDELHSDKKRTAVINREEALDVVLASLQQVDDVGKNVLLNNSNDYAFAYADDIINVPLTGNNYYIIDEDVPFYEMLIHGYIDYSGDVINLSDSSDITDIVLELVEAGASPHFMFSWESSSELKNTALNRFYSIQYDNWKDTAVDIYEQVNGALQYVSGSAIVKHEIISDALRAVTYDNGVTIYVNTGTQDETADGITVPARSYAVRGGQS
ncbi:MAG: DUF5696 domain-containing protein [Clostridiales bacterium]|nr:DUF5696 domain-containing protein [Clostridiales bacterium]